MPTKLQIAALAVPLVGSLIGGVIWVETRYQQVDVAVCQISKSALDLEITANEIRLEFYNKELLVVSSEDGAEHRIKRLGDQTLDLEARQRVIKTELKAKAC